MTAPYSAADLELFARYREARRACQPHECVGGENCWVEAGPPAITKNAPTTGGRTSRCVGCGGIPLSPLLDRFQPKYAR